MAKRRSVPKRSSNPSLRPTKRESRAGGRHGPIRGDLPHGEGGAGARAAEDTGIAAHPSAVIDPGATVGAGTRIWHWTHVMTGARIGRGCSLGQNVFVGTDVVIGDRVKIQNNVSVYEGKPTLLVAFQYLLVTNTTRREAVGAAAMRRVWATRPPRRKIGRLMPAPSLTCRRICAQIGATIYLTQDGPSCTL